MKKTKLCHLVTAETALRSAPVVSFCVTAEALEITRSVGVVGVQPVLIISRQTEHRAFLANRVAEFGLRPICCGSVAQARTLIETEEFSVVLCEDPLPEGDCRSVVCEIHRLACKSSVIVVSQRPDWDSYLVAVGAGAFESVTFPPSQGELERVLWAAVSEWKRSAGTLGQSAA